MYRYHFKANTFFHIFNKSIAHFNIFQKREDCIRFLQSTEYYNSQKQKERLSFALKMRRYHYKNILISRPLQIVEYLSFCIMPDHYHFLIQIKIDDMFSKYMSDLENSFTRYFNLSNRRKGPLWQSRFKAVKIHTDEQLLHVSRYIHLNPTSSQLIDQPEDWEFSSYRNFLSNSKTFLKPVFSISHISTYQQFVENHQTRQLQLKQLRKLFLE